MGIPDRRSSLTLAVTRFLRTAAGTAGFHLKLNAG
jgi:hypothetical protein